ncbi:universal stress protein [Ramlibacter sp. MMS24-I3-19]|uniref:universal stress protein n=1 Tax=Ramlibacter sp. MMS24-I3-19 TaxID=3416606 RepID=UPI003D0481C5
MEPTSILVLTDLSAAEDMAVQRACLLATQYRRRPQVRLMFHASRREPGSPNTSRRLALLARKLQASLELAVTCVPTRRGLLDDVAEAAARADLVVACLRTSERLQDLFTGGPTLALLRRLDRPVLVVRKRPLANYLRAIAAVDLTSDAERLVQVARALQPTCSLELFHAVSTSNESRLRLAEAPERAVRLYRQQCLERANARLGLLRAGVHDGANPVGIGLGFGDPGRQLLLRQEGLRADLLVVGRRPRGAVADFFADSVSRVVLHWARSDVLVIPQGAALRAKRLLRKRRVRAAAVPRGRGAAVRGGLTP